MGVAEQRSGKILSLLDKIAFFKQFSAEEKQDIARLKNSVLTFEDGQYIIRQGDFDFSVFILLKGKVAVSKREVRNAIINTLGPGDVFGELSLLAKRERSTDIISKGASMTLKLDAELFDGLSVSIREKLKDQFVSILMRRLDQMNASVIQLKTELEGIYYAGEQIKENVNGVLRSFTEIKGGIGDVTDAIRTMIR